MQAFAGTSWLALVGLVLLGGIVGGVLRHLWGAVADRAHAQRIASLCDQLDNKDRKLQSLRAELLAERGRVFVLQSGLDLSFPARQLVHEMSSAVLQPEFDEHNAAGRPESGTRLTRTGSNP